MTREQNSQNSVDLERRVLRALCSEEIQPALRGKFLRDLNRHEWRDPEHRIVFEALEALAPADSAALRERLPTQATRMGFPDVEWDIYFRRDEPIGENLRALINRLTRAAAGAR